MKKKSRFIFITLILLFTIGLTIVEISYLLYPIDKNSITKQLAVEYEDGLIRPTDFNNLKYDITEIIIYTEPEEIFKLPLGCNFPILHTPDSLVIATFLDTFAFEWDGISFSETTDSFENKVFFINNKTVIGFTYCCIISTNILIYTDKTGWIRSNNGDRIINALAKFKPSFNPLIFYSLTH